VDDEALFRETLRSLLNGNSAGVRSYQIVEAESAETALKLLMRGEFDYVIADIDMERARMNGYELTQHILSKYQTHACPDPFKQAHERD
jgi:CheY-like chemotaxis protein